MTVRTYRLGEICRMEKGISPTLKTLPGPYPLVVTAGFRRTADTWQIEGPAICIPLVSSTGHGDAAIHRIHYQEGKFALANLLVALIPKAPSVCNAKYLYHRLMTQKDALLVPLMQGTANVSLKEQDIAGVEIPLPPLAEQRRIVARIEAVSAQLSKVRELRQQRDDEIRQMLHSAFHGVADLAPKKAMTDVAPLIRRSVAVAPMDSYSELGIRSFGNGTFHKPSLIGFDIGGKRIFRIEPGDLLFSNVFAWEGAIAVAKPEDAGRVGSHRFMSCIPKDGISTANFLCFYFLTTEGLEKIRAASPGGAGRNRTLGLKALEEIEVPVPAFTKQRWFDSLCEKVDAIKRLQAETAAELDALLPAILDKAFKGEL